MWQGFFKKHIFTVCLNFIFNNGIFFAIEFNFNELGW